MNIAGLKQSASDFATTHTSKASWIALAIAIVGFVDNRYTEKARANLARETEQHRAQMEREISINRQAAVYMAGTNAVAEIEKQTPHQEPEK